MISVTRVIVVAAWILLLAGCPASAGGGDPAAPEAPSRPLPRPASAARASLPTGFDPYATDHYLIAAEDDRLWTMFTGDLLERFRLRFMRAFRDSGFPVVDHREPLVWLGFHDADAYRDHARRRDRLDVSAMPAYYSCRTNHVAMLLTGADEARASRVVEASTGHGDVAPPPVCPGGIEPERIRHEAAHQLAYSLGLMKRGVMYPLWLAEGLATSFETFDTDTTVLTGDHPVRRADLLSAVRNGRLAPLEDFVVMAHLPSSDRRTAVALYGQSWGFWQFLLRTRPGPLRRYMRSLAHLPMGRRRPGQLRGEFVETFGPIDRVEADWRRYLRDLVAQLADGGDGP
ncbi:MAG: DUF1570 domain-containing protein [Planctomycetota bacterium]